MDTDEIMQKQVEQLEKEKKEMQEKLRTQEKKVSTIYDLDISKEKIIVCIVCQNCVVDHMMKKYCVWGNMCCQSISSNWWYSTHLQLEEKF